MHRKTIEIFEEQPANGGAIQSSSGNVQDNSSIGGGGSDI